MTFLPSAAMPRPFVYGWTPFPQVARVPRQVVEWNHPVVVRTGHEPGKLFWPTHLGYYSRADKSYWMALDGKRGHRAGRKGATLRTHRENREIV